MNIKYFVFATAACLGSSLYAAFPADLQRNILGKDPVAAKAAAAEALRKFGNNPLTLMTYTGKTVEQLKQMAAGTAAPSALSKASEAGQLAPIPAPGQLTTIPLQPAKSVTPIKTSTHAIQTAQEQLTLAQERLASMTGKTAVATPSSPKALARIQAYSQAAKQIEIGMHSEKTSKEVGILALTSGATSKQAGPLAITSGAAEELNPLAYFPEFKAQGLEKKITVAQIEKKPKFTDVLVANPKITAEDAYVAILGVPKNYSQEELDEALADEIAIYAKELEKSRSTKGAGIEEIAWLDLLNKSFDLVNIAYNELSAALRQKASK